MGELRVVGKSLTSMRLDFQGPKPASANQAAVTSGPADGTYDSTEQDMLNEIKTLVNQLRLDLVNLGLIKGGA